ncbi:hypothetical protein LTR09_004490 [Extremus antarcticus]|uniref:Uncharacterized protein n=1 Tax=Extremus antarcticus TaxID=702011 RepID=A0AAJ0DIK9_9PEZI|nr:hypothetical protein LTR09_004490 [Extremus antarcticus]
MTTILASTASARAFNSLRLVARTAPLTLRRALSTLPQNEHVYVHEQPNKPQARYLYSYLSATPPIPSLAIGTSPTNPPHPDTLTANPTFLELVHDVIKDHATQDPEVKAQASMYASQAGSGLGSGGVFFPQQRQRRERKRNTSFTGAGGGGGTGGDGAGGASSQGGMGGAGRGGYIHVSDQRNPPDFGRVAWTDDILGSLELDSDGSFVDGHGRYQKSGTYRILTNEGMLGLSDYLREKVVERLRELDGQARKNMSG